MPSEKRREVESLEIRIWSKLQDTFCKWAGHYQLQDAASAVVMSENAEEFDEEHLAFIEERLDVYYQLKRKYEIRCRRNSNNLPKIRRRFWIRLKIKKRWLLKQKKYWNKLLLKPFRLQKISSIRRSVKRLNRYCEQVHSLYRYAICHQLDFRPCRNRDWPCWVLIFPANKGTVKPLSKIVSGGSCRITLAMKSIFTKEQIVGTIIFDRSGYRS